MKPRSVPAIILSVAVSAAIAAWSQAKAEVRAWQGTVTIPTYAWQEDVNPQFWALQGGAKLSVTVRDSIIYPYVMQDHLSRRKVDRTYKALFLENEYLKITCLPELGGRLHSVLDKTQGKEMFHLNQVIKPGMIAMRGAWISGGVEWNAGPHGHTVTILSPVDAIVGKSPDGSGYLEISDLEQIFRTRWTARVTLHPGRAYLDEQIRLENPNDGTHPYYFWNCTAFPNRPATRFIFPMSLGTDHNAREFFRWPVDKGRDLSWLKNYPKYSSIFAVHCTHDFFGAYDGEADRGVVQAADHHELGGKKAWTWGEWEFGKVAQKNLTDTDGPYIEVQSGPLPTQSDYGMLAPRDVVQWQEWWYPVHGLGNGFEYATRDLAAQTLRRDGRLELRLLATARFPRAKCVVAQEGHTVLSNVDLTPNEPAVLPLSQDPGKPVDITVTSKEGRLLARYTSPLPIPKVEPPDPARFVEKPDDQLSVEELFLKGRKADRGTERRTARSYYEKALARDPGHVDSLLGVAVLDFEAGLYAQASKQLQKALDRDSDRGLAWYYLGLCNLRLGNLSEALRCGYRAARSFGTVSLGYDLAGRAAFRQGDRAGAAAAFAKAVTADGCDRTAADHLLLALQGSRQTELARKRFQENPTALVPRAVLFLQNQPASRRFSSETRSFLGDDEFEMLETSLTFAECGLIREAEAIARACLDAEPASQRSFLPFYYLAWYASQRGQAAAAREYLEQAAQTHKDRVFASRPEEVQILRYAVRENPKDAQAHLQLGCLLANLGRVEEAVRQWEKAAALDAQLSIAWRNLGLAAAAKNDLPKAESLYRKAIAARPGDQTLYRDLADILISAGKRDEAIGLLETMPVKGMRRAEIIVMLAKAYRDEHRDADCIKLLESTPYFVNWEGQDVTWRLYNQAHIARGRQFLDRGDARAALADFEAALRYPANLNVGRSDKPEEAPAQYWRGKALQSLGRGDAARAAWQAGAQGADVPGTQNEYRQKCREALGQGASGTKKAKG